MNPVDSQRRGNPESLASGGARTWRQRLSQPWEESLASVVAVTGPHAAGKTALVASLRKLGWRTFSTGDVIRREAAKRGLGQDFETLGRISRDFLLRNQENVLGPLVPSIREAVASGELVAVDGVKTQVEVGQLRALHPGTRLVAVLAPIEVRFARALARRRSDEPPSIGDLRTRDLAELQGGMGVLLGLADYYIVNTGSLRALELAVEGVASAANQTLGPTPSPASPSALGD